MLPPGVALSMVVASAALRLGPAHLGERLSRLAGRTGLRAGSCAVSGTLGDALRDRGQPEQVVREVEVPVGHHRIGVAPTGALAVAAHVLALARNAECGMVEPADAAEHARFDVPGHAVVAEVRQRMAE